MNNNPFSPVSGKNNPKDHYAGPLADWSDCISVGYLAKRAGIERRNLRRSLVVGNRPMSNAQLDTLRPILKELISVLEKI